MQQILSVWTALDTRRRVIVVLATLAMFTAVLTLTRMAAAPSMALLYSGLETTAAGEVLSALESRGVAHEVRGDAIYVDATARDRVRMSLAGEGLPANGSAGYELLDSLSGFGTTSQMFDAAYWRAKEGELARTIVASPHIRQARVHIASPSTQAFARQVRPSASVTVTTGGGALSGDHAKALKYLVASAVAGMTPEDVSIIDGYGGLVGNADEAAPIGGAGSDRAADLKRSVERLLEARVGYGNAVVEVSLETVTDRESIVERRFDPESRVAISTDTEERTNSANGSSGGGAVTVASNLPEGDGASGESQSSQNSETRERVNFEVSETQREIIRSPGAVKRLTVAVLVDGTTEIDGNGAEIFVPRDEAELTALRELVASAVGFNEARGDVITIKSMGFEPVAPAGTAPPAGLLSQLSFDLMSALQLAVLGLVALLLGLFVVRPILTSSGAPARAELPPPLPPQEPPVSAPEPALQALSGEIAGPESAASAVAAGAPVPALAADSAAAGIPPAAPAERLRQLIGERQEETVEILRRWIEEEEEPA